MLRTLSLLLLTLALLTAAWNHITRVDANGFPIDPPKVKPCEHCGGKKWMWKNYRLGKWDSCCPKCEPEEFDNPDGMFREK